MTSSLPRIAIPEPTSNDQEYNQRSWPLYAEAVERAGGIPVLVRLGESQSSLARLAASCSGVLLPGSGADLDPEKYGEDRVPECNPKDAARESADDLLLQDAFNLHKPIFGICYGMQSLNVWRNGALIQDLTSYFDAGQPESPREKGGEPAQAVVKTQVNHRPGRAVQHAHTVAYELKSRLGQILAGANDAEQTPECGRLSVNSSHHQAIAKPGDQMRVVARSPEDAVIEALELEDREQFVLGVQWHPERTYDASAASQALFREFVRAAGAWRPKPISDSVGQ